jgi:LAO/AO transport system kinase
MAIFGGERLRVKNREMKSSKSSTQLADDVRSGDRAALARAITLIESRRADHQAQARDLVQDLLPLTGKAMRVGITGSPGVGKSTTIDALGMALIGKNHKVAVLAVDPSSARTGGSILGDKTRMARLSAEADAFIRPSPSSGTLGGVAAKTREAMLLCEAAGFDVVLVETVGIGQSETAVCDMTDFFLALMLPGAGDELQGIKKGLVELADMIAVNKADGDNLKRAKAAAAEYNAALHILAPRPSTGFRQFSPTLPSLVTESTRCGRKSSRIAPPWLHPANLRNGGVSSRSNGCGRSLRIACMHACDQIPPSAPRLSRPKPLLPMAR